MTTLDSKRDVRRSGLDLFGSAPARRDTRTAHSTRSAVAGVLARRLGTPHPLVVLVDHDAVVIDTYHGVATDIPSTICPVVGQSMSFDSVGVNAIGLAVETRAVVEVVGRDHEDERFSATRTCAVPIRSARTGLVVATLGLIAEHTRTSGMELLWLTEIAAHVEHLLAENAMHRETALMRAFVAANRSSRQPVVVLGDGFAIGNGAANSRLAGTDFAQIRALSADLARWSEARIVPMVLADGTITSTSINPVMDGEDCLGAVVRIRIPIANQGAVSRLAEIQLPGMVGHSTAWLDYCAELTAASTRSLLLLGPAGSGKATTASALLASRRSVATWLDCANWCLGEEISWLRALRDCPAAQPVVVVHVDRLPRSWYTATVAEFNRLANDGVGMIATATVSEGTSLTSQYNEWFESVVRVPGLRARRDDLPLLVEALSRRCVPEGVQAPRWMPDAIQALAGITWSRNVRGLEAVVRDAVSKAGDYGYIGAGSLPPHLLACSTQRSVALLQHNEMTTILQTLRECRGNKRMAAEKLGIARSTLHRKLRSMGMGPVPPA